MRTTVAIIALVVLFAAFIALCVWVPVVKDHYKERSATASLPMLLLFRVSDLVKIWWWALLPVPLLTVAAIAGLFGRRQERD